MRGTDPRSAQFRLKRSAPVAHRTERSAPDRKAAGSIPARRTFSLTRDPLVAASRPSRHWRSVSTAGRTTFQTTCPASRNVSTCDRNRPSVMHFVPGSEAHEGSAKRRTNEIHAKSTAAGPAKQLRIGTSMPGEVSSTCSFPSLPGGTPCEGGAGQQAHQAGLLLRPRRLLAVARLMPATHAAGSGS